VGNQFEGFWAGRIGPARCAKRKCARFRFGQFGWKRRGHDPRLLLIPQGKKDGRIIVYAATLPFNQYNIFRGRFYTLFYASLGGPKSHRLNLGGRESLRTFRGFQKAAGATGRVKASKVLAPDVIPRPEPIQKNRLPSIVNNGWL